MATKWFYPTNTANLAMIISQGLITEPEGFSKYYKDVLDNHPGYIPIYKDMVPLTALSKAKEEDNNLVQCLIEIKHQHILSSDSYDRNGNLIKIPIKDADVSNIDVLYIPAPLPLSCIANICFKSENEKKAFVHDTETILPNVPLNGLSLVVQSKKSNLFDPGDIGDDRSDVSLPNLGSINYKKVYAFGGLLCALFYFTKNGRLSNQQFLDILNSDTYNDKQEKDFCLIIKYFFDIEHKGDAISIVTKILDILVTSDNSQDEIITYLKSDFIVENQKSRAVSLADLLVNFHQSSIDKRPSDYFKDSKDKFSEGKSKLELLLLMLFFRKDTDSLIEYQLDIFDETDYTLFAMLFGMRDKFQKIPTFIKKYEGLQHYISNEMAKYAHSSLMTKTIFKKQKYPLSFIDMLNPNRREFILWVSKYFGIEHCFETIMPNHNFTNIKGTSTYTGIVLPKIEIINDELFSIMSKKEITDTTYCEINSQYKNLK